MRLRVVPLPSFAYLVVVDRAEGVSPEVVEALRSLNVREQSDHSCHGVWVFESEVEIE